MTSSRVALLTATLLLVISQASAQSLDSVGSDLVRLRPTIIDHPSPGSIFIAPMAGPSGGAAEISDDSGHLSYYLRSAQPFTDFKVQPGNRLSYYSSDSNGFVVLDSRYRWLATVRTIGYTADTHDFLILPNGHYLLLGYDSVKDYDVSAIVGKPEVATVLGTVIQELDQDQRLVFQWRGFDEGNFTPADMQYPEVMLNGQLDAVHANSLDVDSAGNIFLSSRHLSEITKIDRATGSIIWRLGGKHNQFAFIGDTLGFSYQHCARLIAPGRLLLFDNGNYHTPKFSRAVEYQIDEQARTATLVWQYNHGQTIFAPFMGSVQRLPDGNTLIGWGGAAYPAPAVTEVRADGSIAYEAQLAPGVLSYRAFRYPWGSQAAVSPTLPQNFVSVLSPNPSISTSQITLIPTSEDHLTISIVDALGRTVRTVFRGTLPAGPRTVEVITEGLPHGAYRLIVESDHGVTVQNFIH